jgi:uncharacterized membrane protein HdeD (DUF308 family)
MNLSNFENPQMSQKWLAFLIRGIFILLFAVTLVVWPTMTIDALVFLFGTYVLIDGAITIWTGAVSQQRDFVMFGLLSILIGTSAFFTHQLSGSLLLTLIIAWSFLRGIFEISTALKARPKMTNEWGLILSGILSIFLGLVSLTVSGSQALVMVWILVGYSVVIGVTWIFLALEIHAIDLSLARIKPLSTDKKRSFDKSWLRKS